MKKIVLNVGDVKIPAVLNDTVAAKDFEKRLPFTVEGNDSGIDYCCAAKEGKFDPKEKQNGWRNGDINLADGWFALLYGGEETSQSYHSMMIIGHFDDIEAVKALPKNVTITVTAE